ncbi:unnamed protein product [Penicillium salamii]|nr:unnamed protein product [Penicillium salamii]CAG8420304.1 unnamed protein product [Penicillium salamii]
MANTADVIILSSSPNPPRSPGPVAQHEIKAPDTFPRSATPTPAPAAKAKPAKPATRSRYFATPSAADKNNENAKQPRTRVSRKAAPPNSDDQSIASKPHQKAKRSTNKPVSIGPGDPPVEDAGTNANTPKQSKGRPRKTAKSKAPANMTLAGKVTKTSGDPPPKNASKRTKKTTKTDTESPGDCTEIPASEESNALRKDEVLHLDEALRRRVDWTPPRETPCGDIAVMCDDNSQDEGGAGPNGTLGIGKSLSDYNYIGNAFNPRDLIQKSTSEAPTKRRRIDLVDPLVQSALNGKPDSFDQALGQDQSVAGKAKKTTNSKPKKFTTLTARMTAQYAIDDDQEDEPAAEWAPEVKTTKSRRSKAKEAAQDPRFTILSPEAAVEFVNDQDLVFGTCSQLEREDSPQTMREMQQAIRASEILAYSEGIRDPPNSPGAMQGPTVRSVSKLTGTRNLWCVASRDTEGSLVQAKAQNVIDLTDQVESPQKDLEQVNAKSRQTLPDNWFEHAFADIDPTPEKKALPSTMIKDSSASVQQAQVSLPSHAPALAPASDVKGIAIESTKGTGSGSTEAVNHQTVGPKVPSMPNYAGFTDAELSKQVSTFGFKAVRGRKKMIELLQQCWESKHGSSIPVCDNINQSGLGKTPIPQSAEVPKLTSSSKHMTKTRPPVATTIVEDSNETNITVSQARTSIQTSPQRQTRDKSATSNSTSFLDIEEIQDSEEEITPSPSHVQKHHNEISLRNKAAKGVIKHSLNILTKTPPQSPTKRKVVSSKPSATKKVSSTSSTCKAISRVSKSSERVCLADISTQITKAVRMQPRSSSLGSRIHPTWHEKILMYDPIVLEDFTAWLNTEGLGLVGEDFEVGTASVREWCESKGICCCWKKNASW